MAKIANELKQQMNMEGVKEQAQQCQAIYDKLMEMDGGHLWQRKWDQLVKVCSRRDEKGEVEFYHAPTEIGEIFLKGLAADKHQDGEELKVKVLCFYDRDDDYKGLLMVANEADVNESKRQEIIDIVRPAFCDEEEFDDKDEEELFQNVISKVIAGEDAEFHEYTIYWDTSVML